MDGWLIRMRNDAPSRERCCCEGEFFGMPQCATTLPCANNEMENIYKEWLFWPTPFSCDVRIYIRFTLGLLHLQKSQAVSASGGYGDRYFCNWRQIPGQHESLHETVFPIIIQRFINSSSRDEIVNEETVMRIERSATERIYPFNLLSLQLY